MLVVLAVAALGVLLLAFDARRRLPFRENVGQATLRHLGGSGPLYTSTSL
jgi:hypothetical protein